MVFSSLAFIFGFLPVLLAVYYFVDDRYKNVVLLVGSLLFYAWGGPKYLILLMTEALVSWGLALLIDAAEGAREKRLYLVLECVVLLGLLGYFALGFFALVIVGHGAHQSLVGLVAVDAILPDASLFLESLHGGFRLAAEVTIHSQCGRDDNQLVQKLLQGLDIGASGALFQRTGAKRIFGFGCRCCHG